MNKLTEKQQKVLEAIKKYQKEHGFPPTVKELAKEVGLSPSTAYGYLERLEYAGVLRRIPGSPRALEIIDTKNHE